MRSWWSEVSMSVPPKEDRAVGSKLEVEDQHLQTVDSQGALPMSSHHNLTQLYPLSTLSHGSSGDDYGALPFLNKLC